MFKKINQSLPFLSSLLFLMTPITGCRTTSAGSSIKVTGGRPIDRSDPLGNPVVALRTSIGGYCTGTFITPTTLITAAHCTMTEKDGTGSMVSGGGLYLDRSPAEHSINAFIPQDFVATWTQPSTRQTRDVAIVVFNASASKAVNVTKFAHVSDTPPSSGDKVTMIGWGSGEMKDPSTYGVLRKATNTIGTVGHDVITVIGTSHMGDSPGNGASAPGDSGGPLFDESGGLIGIVSTHWELDSDSHRSTYFNATGPFAGEQFFPSTINCSTPPCAEPFLGN